MYSLIVSLVIVLDLKAGALMGMSACPLQFKYGFLGTKWACAWFKNGSCAFQSHVHSLHVLCPSSANRSLILDVSMCNMICYHHENPTNGPMGDPSMVRLP